MKTKKRLKDKGSKEKEHFKRRFSERHGIELNDNDIVLIVKQINTGNTTYRGKESKRIELHNITYNDNIYLIVYDKFRRTPVTTLFEGEGFRNENCYEF